MKKHSSHIKGSLILLTKGSQKAIPFNIVLAFLLTLNMIYNQVPKILVFSWFVIVIILSLVRLLLCHQILNNKLYQEKKQNTTLIKFVLLTLLMGSAWGSCYFITLPYLTPLQEFILILVFGGMSAGSIASLSIYLPAYYAYITPMFLPVIIYNYSLFDPDRFILATMFLLFVVMLIISAKINKNLLDDNFELAQEKDSLIRDLQIISITDSLTGLFNRRYFEETLPKEINKAKIDGYLLHLISIDVDNFKLINDNLGHPSGDKFLINLGKLLQNICNLSNGTLFRLGGDEFAAIIGNRPIRDTLNACQSIQSKFKHFLQTEYSTEQYCLDKVTLSMGMVTINFKYLSDVNEVVTLVDQALYQAKKQGKNQIIVKKLH